MKTLAKYHFCNHCVIGDKIFKNTFIGPSKLPGLSRNGRLSFIDKLCKFALQDIHMIQCINILCKAVNNHASKQSDHVSRVWYHGTAALKECPQALSPFLPRPRPRIFCSPYTPLGSLFAG